MMDYIYDHLAEFKILVTNGGERYDEFMHRVVELNSATTTATSKPSAATRDGGAADARAPCT